MRFRALSVVVAGLALPACAHVARGVSPPALRCAVHELSREPLVLDDRTHVYVEADAFVADAQGSTLLAGTPNSLTRMNAEGAVTAVVDDSVLGVVIPRTGRAHPIPLPISVSGKLDGIRVAAQPNGGWAVGFAEVKRRQGSTTADSTARLWYGTYDGTRWTSLEELPLPRSGTVDSRWASSLATRGDSVSWAMTHRTAAGTQIVLFERRATRWSHELIPTFHSQVELGQSDSLGLVLFVVQPHLGPGELSDGNSLVLWARRPQWQPVRRLVHGSVEGRVYDPNFTPSAEGGVLTWRSVPSSRSARGAELRATFGGWEGGTLQPVVLDSAVGNTGYSNMVSLRAGKRVWASVRAAAEGGPKLRFLSDSGQSSATLGETVNPYSGFIAAAAPDPDHMLVTGLQYIPNRYFVSLLLRATLTCGDGPIAP